MKKEDKKTQQGEWGKATGEQQKLFIEYCMRAKFKGNSNDVNFLAFKLPDGKLVLEYIIETYNIMFKTL